MLFVVVVVVVDPCVVARNLVDWGEFVRPSRTSFLHRWCDLLMGMKLLLLDVRLLWLYLVVVVVVVVDGVIVVGLLVVVAVVVVVVGGAHAVFGFLLFLLMCSLFLFLVLLRLCLIVES